MGAHYSTITRDLTCCLVRALDANITYRSQLRSTLSLYSADQSINQSDAMAWTSEKFVNDLLDPNTEISKLFNQQLKEFESINLLINDRQSISHHLARASLLLMDELKLDLAVHVRLIDACKIGDFQRVKKLVSFVDFEFCDSRDGCSPLMIAAHHGHQSIVSFILSLDPPPSINQSDAFGWTPLMHAARQGHAAIVRMLLNAGAFVNSLNASSCSALMCAADSGHYEVVRLLLVAGASVKLASRSGDTALIQATRNGHLLCVKALIAASSNVDHAGARDRTALIHAAANARYDLIELLVAHGASLDWVDEDGSSVCSFEASSLHDNDPAKPSKGVGLIAAAIQRGIVVRFNRLISRPVKNATNQFVKMSSINDVDEFDLNEEDAASEEHSENESVNEADDESGSGSESDNESQQSASRSRYSESRSRTGSMSESRQHHSDDEMTISDEDDTHMPGESNGSPPEGLVVPGEDSEGEVSPGAHDVHANQQLPASLSFSHGARTQSTISQVRPSTPPLQRKVYSHTLFSQPAQSPHQSPNSLTLPHQSVVVHKVPSPVIGPIRLTMEVRKPKRRAPAPVPRVTARARILALRQAAFVPNSHAARQLRHATATSASEESMEDSSHDSDDTKQSPSTHRDDHQLTQSQPSSRALRPLFPRESMQTTSSSSSSHPDEAELDCDIEQVLQTIICPSPSPSPQAGEASPSPPARSSPPPAIPSPPPVILVHDSWRLHLDTTPLKSWLQHYDFDERVIAQCDKMNLNFRSIYAWTEEAACQRLGVKHGQRLFSCLRSYARAVQRAYTERDQAHKANSNNKSNENTNPASLNVPTRPRDGAVKRQEARILEPPAVASTQPKSNTAISKPSTTTNAASLGAFASTTASNLLATLTSTLEVPRNQHARTGSSGSDTFVSLISSLGSLNSSSSRSFMES